MSTAAATSAARARRRGNGNDLGRRRRVDLGLRQAGELDKPAARGDAQVRQGQSGKRSPRAAAKRRAARFSQQNETSPKRWTTKRDGQPGHICSAVGDAPVRVELAARSPIRNDNVREACSHVRKRANVMVARWMQVPRRTDGPQRRPPRGERTMASRLDGREELGNTRSADLRTTRSATLAAPCAIDQRVQRCGARRSPLSAQMEDGHRG